MRDDEWTIRRQEDQAGRLYVVRWSPWGKMDRWIISRRVPAESGIFQLWVSENRGQSLLTTEAAFYGGLRSTLRETIDELAPAGRRLRELIAGRECWFRYSLSPYRETIEDMMWWFSGRRPEKSRSDEVRIVEKETLGQFAPPPPDIAVAGRKRMRDGDYGPPLEKVREERRG